MPDIDIDASYLAQAALLVPFVLGLVEVFKRLVASTAIDQDRFAPIVSIVIGIILAFLVIDTETGKQVLAGIVAGLSASGLWSGTRAVVSGE